MDDVNKQTNSKEKDNKLIIKSSGETTVRQEIMSDNPKNLLERKKEEEKERQKAIRKLEMEEAERMRKKIKIDISKRENFQTQKEIQEKREIEKAVQQKLGTIKRPDSDIEMEKPDLHIREYNYITRRKEKRDIILTKEEQDETQVETTGGEDISKTIDYMQEKGKRKIAPRNIKVAEDYKKVMSFYDQNHGHKVQQSIGQDQSKKKSKAKKFRDQMRYAYEVIIKPHNTYEEESKQKQVDNGEKDKEI